MKPISLGFGLSIYYYIGGSEMVYPAKFAVTLDDGKSKRQRLWEERKRVREMRAAFKKLYSEGGKIPNFPPLRTFLDLTREERNRIASETRWTNITQ